MPERCAGRNSQAVIGRRDQASPHQLQPARPTDIGRHYLLDRFRPDAEFSKAWQDPTDDVVCLEEVNLAGGEWRTWQELKQPRQNARYREWNRHEQPPFASEPQREQD
jgi:hypothetical protein